MDVFLQFQLLNAQMGRVDDLDFDIIVGGFIFNHAMNAVMARVAIEYDFFIIDKFVDCGVPLEVANSLEVECLVLAKEEHVDLFRRTLHQFGHAVQPQLAFNEVIVVAGLNVGQRAEGAVGEAAHFLQFLQVVQIVVRHRQETEQAIHADTLVGVLCCVRG